MKLKFTLIAILFAATTPSFAQEEIVIEEAPAVDSLVADTAEAEFDLEALLSELDGYDAAPKTKFKGSEWSIGSNSFLNADNAISATGEGLRPWTSWNTRFGFVSQRKLGGTKSPVLLKSGVAFEFNQFGFQTSSMLIKDPTTDGATTVFAPIENVDVRHSNWQLWYLEVPLMLNFDFSKEGKVNESFHLAIGGYAGVRLSSNYVVSGRDLEGFRYKQSTLNNLNSNIVRYGLMTQIGLKGFTVTGRLDASTIFTTDAFQEGLYIGSIGIGMTI